MEYDQELLNEFVGEAAAHLMVIETGLLRLEEGEGDDETVNEVFRAAHSIKGTASFFGLTNIVEVAHAIEHLFDELREHTAELNGSMMDALLMALDLLKEMVQHPRQSSGYEVQSYVQALRGDTGLPPKDLPAAQTAASVWDLWEQLSGGDAPPKAAESSLVESAGEAEKAPAAEMPVKPPLRRSEELTRGAVLEDSVRVNVTLLNDLLNMVGEMVLRRNQLLRIADEAGREVEQLDAVAQGINELTTNLQKKVMKTRMQPVANVFNKFPRIVRDLSRKVGKEVDLVTQGATFELDRSLIEGLVDPITHLVRNALDHGFESPEERSLQGKPLVGTLLMRAYPEGGRMVIDISDDGRGIDLEKIRAIAIKRGLISSWEAAGLKDSEVLQYIMKPGFSTAQQVTDLSGRGVGMDVVRTNIEKMGGKIEILSDKHVGTKFRLVLPLTLAIISALIVTANGQTFAVPRDDLRELVLIWGDDGSSSRLEMLYNRPVLRLRDKLIPVARLGDLMNEETAIEAWCPEPGEVLRILVVKAGGASYGLLVDAVHDMEEILVKPLSPIMTCSLYSGMTVMGDGNIAMILDMDSLRSHAGISVAENGGVLQEMRLPKVMDDRQYLLLFTCSGGELLGLDLAMVARVEEITLQRLQKIGSKFYLHLHGQTIQVIKPEHYLPIGRRKTKPEKLYVIIPKYVSHVIGFIAEKICDAVQTKIELDQSGVSGPGLLGSAMVDGKVVALINMHVLLAKAAPEYYDYPEHQQGAKGRRTILLAEDTPFFLKVVKSYLESDGYQVITAENGQEALEKLRHTAVDAVVSDIEMPVMSGLELVRIIKGDASLCHLPVIALTSLAGDDHKEKGLRAGFDIYEYKLDRARLLESLRALLRP